ncbi:hypothetical protein [Pannonibacter sp. SL95]|uniref:hypothetical protein n=1 Tax=Pannonibacter sp. SL95 TaxID=2995153 RepID=UPI003FA3B065
MDHTSSEIQIPVSSLVAPDQEDRRVLEAMSETAKAALLSEALVSGQLGSGVSSSLEQRLERARRRIDVMAQAGSPVR